MIILVIEHGHRIMTELPVRLGEDVELRIHQLQIGAGYDGTALMLCLAFLHALQRQLHLTRKPHVVMVAKHVIVGFHIAQHPHKSLFSSEISAAWHDDDTLVTLSQLMYKG